MKYRLGSLFSGIGGFELGFEMTGQFETVFQVEINEFCRRILEKHWQNVARYTDAKTVGKHNLPRCDILIGGFPCQDVSVAGRGAGLAGSRTSLWWEFHRIISEIRPRVVVLENVPGLATRGLNTVIAALSALGYDAEWQTVSAASVGAPHLRERYFIVAYTSSELRDGGAVDTKTSEPSTPKPRDSNGSQDLLNSSSARCEEFDLTAESKNSKLICGSVAERKSGWLSEPPVCGVVDGVSARLDRNRVKRLQALGNAVVSQVARVVAQKILDSDLLEARV